MREGLERINTTATKTIELEAIEFGIARAWEAREFSHMPMPRLSLEAERVTLRLYHQIHGQRESVTDSRTISYPTDWWAGVKLRWFPAWWLKRWPAEMTHEVVVFRANARALFPSLRIPEHRAVFQVEVEVEVEVER